MAKKVRRDGEDAEEGEDGESSLPSPLVKSFEAGCGERRKMLQLLRMSSVLPLNRCKPITLVTSKELLDLKPSPRFAAPQKVLQSKCPQFANLLGSHSEDIASVSLLHKAPSASSDTNPSNPAFVTIVLLNSYNLIIKCDTVTRAQDILNLVIRYIEIPPKEAYLLGLALKVDNEYHFVEDDLRVASCLSEEVTLHLRFKFYVDSIVDSIEDSLLQRFFYYQLRQDVLDYTLLVDDVNALSLVGFALQAEFGDFEDTFQENYFSVDNYLPKRVVEAFDYSPRELASISCQQHCLRKGLSSQEAETQFIKLCTGLTHYGNHFHGVFQDKFLDNSSFIWLGITVKGIGLFRRKYSKAGNFWERKRFLLYQWTDILRITLNCDYFAVTPRLETDFKVKYKFFTDGATFKNRSLFHLSVQHHQFASDRSLLRDLYSTLVEGRCEQGAEKLAICETSYSVKQDKNRKIVVGNSSAKKTRASLPMISCQKQDPEKSDDWQTLSLSSSLSSLAKSQTLMPPNTSESCDKIDSGTQIVSDSGLLIRRKGVTAPCEGFSGYFEAQLTTEDNNHGAQEEEEQTLVEVVLKKRNGGLGLKLKNGPSTPDGSGIFVRSLTPGGSATLSGNIEPGDEILEVNGIRLNGIPYLDAVSLLRDSPLSSHLLVKRPANCAKKLFDMSSRQPFPENGHDSSSPSLPINEGSQPIRRQDKSSTCNQMLLRNEPSSPDQIDSNTRRDVTNNDLVPVLRTVHDIHRLVTSNNCFEVKLKKNKRGLGFAIFGGIDVKSDDPIDHLIRIKKVFPSEPASECHFIEIGDILLEANGHKIVGLANIDAVNLLHGMPDEVTLKMVRIKLISTLRIPTGSSASPSPTPRDEISSPHELSPSFVDHTFKEPDRFKVTLNKIEGSLGFTIIKKEDGGLFVKDIIKEPAISESNITSGDRILLVNGTDVSSMSHSGAISFLRGLPDTVTLLLEPSGSFEDELDTSLTISPNKGAKKAKPLRHEARMMLKDRAQHESLSKLKARKERRKSREVMIEAVPKEENAVPSERLDKINDLRSKSLNLAKMLEEATDRVSNGFPKIKRQTSAFQAEDQLSSLPSKAADAPEKVSFVRWRGTTLAESSPTNGFDLNSLGGKDEQDSGFGGDTEPMAPKIQAFCEESRKPETELVVARDEVTKRRESLPFEGKTMDIELTRGWMGRLGISLVDDPHPEGYPRACQVRAVFPQSVAAIDGRVKVGFKLLAVNEEPMIDRPAKEVIDLLRKTRGNLRLMFLLPLQQSDL